MTKNRSSFPFSSANRHCMRISVVLVLLFFESAGCVSHKVIVRSTPSGAHVFLNGVEQGQSPFETELIWKEGNDWEEETTHRIAVEANEYERQERVLPYSLAKSVKGPWKLDFALDRVSHVIPLKISSEPVGARVYIGDESFGQTPVEVPIRFQRASSRSGWGVATVRVEASDYESEGRRVSYHEASRREGPYALHFDLKKLVEVLDVRIEASPPSASIAIDGISKGRGSIEVPIRFTRSASHRPWSNVEVEASLKNYQTRRVALSYLEASRGKVTIPSLVEICKDVPVNIISNVEGTQVSVDGSSIGETPIQRSFRFTRRGADSAWSSFLVNASKDGYRWKRPGEPGSTANTDPFMTTLTLKNAMSGELRIELEPIRFVWTKLRYYKFDGENAGVAEELVLAQVGEIESEPMVQSVTRMTDRRPGELMDTRIWVDSSGQQFVYSVPFTRPEVTRGELCNLWRQVGQGVTRLTDGSVIDFEASVSTDGQFSYFSANRLRPDKFNLWRVRMTGQGGFTKITDSPSSIRDTDPVSSPDGTRVAYTSYLRGVRGVPQIWVAQADGTLPTQLRVGESPSWSPDGRKLAYVARDDDNFQQIWVMNVDGSNPTKLTSGSSRHLYPLWTSDGQRIVYASNQAINAEGLPNYDIWIMSESGIDRTQLTVNGSWDSRPAVSPDGKYIYFLSNRGTKKTFGDNWQIWRIGLK